MRPLNPRHKRTAVWAWALWLAVSPLLLILFVLSDLADPTNRGAYVGDAVVIWGALFVAGLILLVVALTWPSREASSRRTEPEHH